MPSEIPPSTEAVAPALVSFRGGVWGALAPFALFLGGVSWLGLSGAPDESGFGPVLLVAIGVGLLLSRNRAAYADSVIDGMSERIVMLLILSWLLAGVLGALLAASGLVEALVAVASTTGVRGGGYVAAVFMVAAIFSTATGTSLGTLLVCAPLLYPAASGLGADPAFAIGALLAGATFGDNISPVSDTTIASATTQGADLGGVVRSRMRYALPAAAVALLIFMTFGGAEAGPSLSLGPEPPTGALWMLLVPALVLTMLVRGSHLVVGLFAGAAAAVIVGVALRRFLISDLLYIDTEQFLAQGLLLDGMRRSLGVSVFTILLMGLVGGLRASGVLARLMRWIGDRAQSARSTEWWIFGSISAATILTTHSTVAILTVGPLAREVGERRGVHQYRRANLLDVTVCTYPFLLPFFIPTVLAASLTGADGSLRVSPLDAGLHNVHSWALLAVLLISLVGRRGKLPHPSEE